MADYAQVPSTAKVQPEPYKVEIDANDIQSMKHLLAHSRIGPATYENQQKDRRFGMNRDWLIEAKKHWEGAYEWRRCEQKINSFPNFTIPITDDQGSDFTIHFIALFSKNPNAIPLAFFHGWPGSILEFLDMLSVIKKQYPDPADLPYHIIVPSLPGYAFSSSPPVDRDFKAEHMAPVMDALMQALGFGDRYIAQGGDLGSFIARQLGVESGACKVFLHLQGSYTARYLAVTDFITLVNLYTLPPPSNADSLHISDLEKKGLERGKAFRDSGSAYAMEHGTRTATIGLTLSSSPLALLSWIGEKFLEWTDEDPSVDEILDSVSLYWLTDTYARCIYPYRSLFGSQAPGGQNPRFRQPSKKPQGYSYFPKEISPTPISWVKETGNFVFTNSHEKGGHFAAMEKPEELWGDVENFVKEAWGKEKGWSKM
ncbi:alpha/beta-hydrolase [Aureobasidium subglaciale]|nr:alpha/beta-hydrolase [Aureobasidium subglaciale]